MGHGQQHRRTLPEPDSPFPNSSSQGNGFWGAREREFRGVSWTFSYDVKGDRREPSSFRFLCLKEVPETWVMLNYKALLFLPSPSALLSPFHPLAGPAVGSRQDRSSAGRYVIPMHGGTRICCSSPSTWIPLMSYSWKSLTSD